MEQQSHPTNVKSKHIAPQDTFLSGIYLIKAFFHCISGSYYNHSLIHHNHAFGTKISKLSTFCNIDLY